MKSPVPPLGLVALAGLAQRAFGRRASSRARTAAAGVLAAGSAGLLAGSVLRFRRRETTVNPVDPAAATSLVTDGPNGITRNPMYVGMAGMLAANALQRGAWLAGLPVGAFVLAIDRLQIPAEEDALRAHFGAEYDEYCARVPRWLGQVRSRSTGTGPA